MSAACATNRVNNENRIWMKRDANINIADNCDKLIDIPGQLGDKLIEKIRYLQACMNKENRFDCCW